MDGNQRISYRERRVPVSRAARGFTRGSKCPDERLTFSARFFGRGPGLESSQGTPRPAHNQHHVDRRGLAWDQKGEINPMAKPKIHVAVGGSKDSCGEPGIGPKNSLILNWSRRRRNYVFITVVGARPYTENPPRSASRSGVFVAPTRSM